MRIKIVSGGQTGADRGGLDAAIQLGIPHGGWCPKERKAEDGAIPDIYKLAETSSSDYRVRTEKNVVDSDATVIFTRGPLDGGSLLTAECAMKHSKPCHHVDLAKSDTDASISILADWIKGVGYESVVLNVAGSRESKSPGIKDSVTQVLRSTLKVIL